MTCCCIFLSTFSLNNSGETLSLIVDSVVVNSLTYTNELGAKGDGNSLQIYEDILIPASPTAGLENTNELAIIRDIDNEEISAGEEDTSSHDSYIELSNLKEEEEISIGAGRNRVGNVDIPINFKAIYDTDYGKYLKFSWIFGDGTFSKGKNVEHKYKYPGIYNVVLHAVYKNLYAVARTKIEIFETGIDLEISTSTNNILLKISNDTNKEINIGEFKIVNGNNTFSFPRDTIVDSKGHLFIDEEIMGFVLDYEIVKLVFPDGEILTTLEVPVFHMLSYKVNEIKRQIAKLQQ